MSLLPHRNGGERWQQGRFKDEGKSLLGETLNINSRTWHVLPNLRDLLKRINLRVWGFQYMCRMGGAPKMSDSYLNPGLPFALFHPWLARRVFDCTSIRSGSTMGCGLYSVSTLSNQDKPDFFATVPLFQIEEETIVI